MYPINGMGITTKDMSTSITDCISLKQAERQRKTTLSRMTENITLSEEMDNKIIITVTVKSNSSKERFPMRITKRQLQANTDDNNIQST